MSCLFKLYPGKMEYHLRDATSSSGHAVDSLLTFSKRQDIERFSVFLLRSDPLEY